MFQVSILKVLASYPDGHASIDALKADMQILMSAGPDWTKHMKRLAVHAPALNVFAEGYVSRGDAGWKITAEGLKFLERIQESATEGSSSDSEFVPAADAPVFVFPDRVTQSASTRPANAKDRRKTRRRRDAVTYVRYA